MKILSTQLSDLFQRIAMHEEVIDDMARLLAQAAISEGTIFLAAFDEMKAVTIVVLEETETLSSMKEWTPESILTSVDRVFILAKKDEGDELAGRLSDAAISFAMLCAESKKTDVPEVFLSLDIEATIGTHNRNTAARVMAALFVYQSIELKMDKMLSEESH